MRLFYRIKNKLTRMHSNYKQLNAKPNRNAIWIFGVQKSGTSAIAGLLAKRSNKSVTLDTPTLWDPFYSQMLNAELDIITHIKSNPYPFSKTIIKEPVASLFVSELDTYFNMDKYVFIYRNPHDVIRSILNRLHLPGDRKDIDLNEINENWRVHFKDGTNYIKSLTELWIKVYSQEEAIDDQRCIFVKYEDFLKDKIEFIDDLCEKLNLSPKNNITEILDYNFQPRGRSNTNLNEFFGEDNYNYILNETKKYLR